MKTLIHNRMKYGTMGPLQASASNSLKSANRENGCDAIETTPLDRCQCGWRLIGLRCARSKTGAGVVHKLNPNDTARRSTIVPALVTRGSWFWRFRAHRDGSSRVGLACLERASTREDAPVALPFTQSRALWGRGGANFGAT